MIVKLLKKIGDHEVGTELDIKDESVIKKWKELKVIASDKKEDSKKDKEDSKK